MQFPSITKIIVILFVLYIAHSMFIMAQIFMNLKCTDIPCFESVLINKPRLQLALFTSISPNPIAIGVKKIYQLKNFNYADEFRHELEIDVPLKARRNGTLYMQVVLAKTGKILEWDHLLHDETTVIHTVCLTNYMVPRAKTFNLLNDATKKTAHNEVVTEKPLPEIIKFSKPVTHIMSSVHVGLLTDKFSVSSNDVPPEMSRLIRFNRNNKIMPILITDHFNIRYKDRVQVTRNTTEFKLTFVYKPIGIGKFRLILLTDHSLRMIESMGFSEKDVDDMKGLFSDINVVLLCATVFIASVHMLFDILSIKNDVSFWRLKKSYEGLSTRTTLWRAFSKIIIFLSLMDESASLLVMVPCGAESLIELWKCKKILKVNIGWDGIKSLMSSSSSSSSSTKLDTSQIPNDESHENAAIIAEKKTEELDKEGMRYLSYLLYPLCISGAIYSLIYQPHKSWYSWTLSSLVNGVYAFGFLFMLPQLFINYKLKSVAALPWRAFMYKAFNTFIDDFFACIITMPTAHRVACLRDDVVFIIYLYQRWLYPVDKNRVDESIATISNRQEEDENELKKDK